MADCEGQMLDVAVMEDGSASVTLPVTNWRDVKAVRTVPDLGNAVRVLLADQRVQIYGAPSGMMVGVCIDFLSDDEKAANEDAESAAAQASVAEVHDAKVADAQAQVDAAEAQVPVPDAEAEAAADEAEAERIAAAEQAVKDAQAALDAANASRADALKDVENGQ